MRFRPGVTFESRVAFVTEAAIRVCRGPDRLDIDCSPLVAFDEATIGTLALVARNAATRGVTIVLHAPATGLLDTLDNAGNPRPVPTRLTDVGEPSRRRSRL